MPWTTVDSLIDRCLIMLSKQSQSDMTLAKGALQRRRRERLDLDLTEFEGMRVQVATDRSYPDYRQAINFS